MNPHADVFQLALGLPGNVPVYIQGSSCSLAPHGLLTIGMKYRDAPRAVVSDCAALHRSGKTKSKRPYWARAPARVSCCASAIASATGCCTCPFGPSPTCFNCLASSYYIWQFHWLPPFWFHSSCHHHWTSNRPPTCPYCVWISPGPCTGTMSSLGWESFAASRSALASSFRTQSCLQV